MISARRLAIRIRYSFESFQRYVANLQAKWADFCTPALTASEWVDIMDRFPKLAKHYHRGILTAGEVARVYRTERAFELAFDRAV